MKGSPTLKPNGPHCPRCGRPGYGVQYTVNGHRNTKPNTKCPCQRRYSK